MPIIVYFTVIVLFAFSFRIKKDNGFLDKNSSDVIKGLFILLIVFSHILNAFPYSGFGSLPLKIFRGILGQLCVSMFFFISGYGIFSSIDKNGNKYSKSILSNRLFRLFIYTSISLVPFFIYSAILGKNHPISDYFLAFIGLKSFGNVTTWFIFAIFVCYLLTGIVFLFSFKNKFIPVCIISSGTIIYVVVMYFLKMEYYWWDTIVCFPFGIIAWMSKNKINDLLSKKKFIPFIVMAISISIVGVLQWSGIPLIIKMPFTNFFFCLFFVALTKVFALKSSFFCFLGRASWAVYLMHLFVVCCFTDIGTIPNEWINYLVLFVSAVLIGIPFFYLYKLLDKYVVNPIVNLNRNHIKE